MKKRNLLLTLLILPFSVNADVSAPATVPFYVKPINSEVKCIGDNNKEYILDESKSYYVDEYAYTSLYSDNITITYNKGEFCVVNANEVVGVESNNDKTPTIKYEGKVLAKGLVLREGPSKTFKKILTIPQFANIKYGVYYFADTNETGEWIYTEYNGKSGWVYANNEYVAKKIDETEAIVGTTWTVTDLVTDKKYDIESGSIIKTSYMTYNVYGSTNFFYVDEEENKFLVNAIVKSNPDTYIKTKEEITMYTDYGTRDKDKIVAVIPNNSKVKVLYNNNYGLSTEMYVEYNDKFGFIDGYDNIEYINEPTKTTTTASLKEELESCNELIIYSIIGVVIGVISTVIIMILINKKKNKKIKSLAQTTNIASDVIDSIQKELDKEDNDE